MMMMIVMMVISISVEFGTITRIPNKKVRNSMMTVVTMQLLMML